RAAARPRHAVSTFPSRALPARRILELHWPALLVACACAGLALSVWISVTLAVAVAIALCVLGVALRVDGLARVAALAAVLTILGLAWGSLRMEALRASVLAERVGQTGQATLVTVAP